MQIAHTYLLTARQQEISELEALLNTCALVRLSGKLIHALQSERGTANLYVAGHHEPFLKLHQEKAAETDAQLENLIAILTPSLGTSTAFVHRSTLLARIALALQSLEVLGQIRSEVGALELDPASITSRYTEIVRALMALIFEATDITADPEVSQRLLALFNLIEAKESAGLERATGSRMLASGTCSPSDQTLLATLIQRQEQSIEHFQQFCGANGLAQWEALERTLPMAELERTRRKLLTQPIDADIKTSEAWFITTSARLDGLHCVETYLTDQIRQSCLARIEQNRAKLADQTHQVTASHDLPHGLKEAAQNLSNNLHPEQHLGSRLNRSLLDILQEQSNHLQQVSSELAAVRMALEDRKLIDRAKGLLMQQQGLTEDAAYHLLRQKAMQQNMRLSEIAASLLAMADLLTPKKG